MKPEREIKGVPPHEKFPCSCGRSPTGQCIGWHKLTEEEYMDEFKKFNDKNTVNFE